MPKLISITVAIIALALSGCGLLVGTQTVTPPASPPPSLSPLPADTAAPALTPGATDTSVIAPTLPAATGTGVATAATAVTATPVPGSTSVGSPTAASSAASQAAGTDKADFAADITVPDSTTFTAGQGFVKTWQLKNSGTNPWTTAYALVFVRGDQMGGPATMPLSATVAPGATSEISVNLTAPSKLGTFTGFWMLRNAAGKLFGIGADANQPVYLKINVGGAAGTPLPTAVAGAVKVSAATLSVDQASFTGACPRTFTFNGTLTSSGAGTISYQLEASSDKPGFVFNLPKAVSAPITGAGPRTFSIQYQLQFTASVGGQAWLHVLSPNNLTSDKVNFSLTCQP